VNPRVHLFGVRHHSPQAARLVLELIDEVAPDAVLVEGPVDFQPQIGELALEHRPPVAIYSSVIHDGRRLAAYHPFCEYSPEWQAIRSGLHGGRLVRLIDLPWAMLAGADAAEELNLYGDQELHRSPALPALLERLGVDRFDDAWDLLVEVDPDLSLPDYRARVDALCRELRGAEEHVPSQDLRRERFMAAQVRDVLQAVNGPVVVVTGGFHTEGLRRLLAAEPQDAEPVSSSRDGDGRVVALTPYSYAALDALAGYAAGMPSPGFYDLVWHARNGHDQDRPAQVALQRIVKRLRELDQLVSPADLIALGVTAEGLAALRGHPEVWRRDLVDGILGALVKDELDAGIVHPMLATCLEVLRGDALGLLAEGASRPPLATDLEERLRELDLEPAARRRGLTLDLRVPRDLERSRLLHGAAVLALPGFEAVDVIARPQDGALQERWTVWRHAGLPGAAIEASAYGASVAAAVGGRLLELAGRLQHDAAGAAALLQDALLAGSGEVAGPLVSRVTELIGSDPDIASVSRAAGSLLHLFRYESILGTAGDAGAGALLVAAYERLLWLLDPGGGAVPPEDAGVEAIAQAIEILERSGDVLALERVELLDVLQRLDGDAAASSGLRGAALGARWVLDAVAPEALDGAPLRFADPDALGDFLFGLFRIAREAAQRRPELLRAVDRLVLEWSPETFLVALPALRRAFSALAPREKDRAARLVLGETLEPGADLAEAEELAHVEASLGSVLTRFGLRGAP
jgi:hypothetical protein